MAVFDSGGWSEVSRPEWVVKTYYVTKFFSVLKVFRIYVKSKLDRGFGNPRLRNDVLSEVMELFFLMYAKLYKRRFDLPNIFKIVNSVNNGGLNDDVLYLALLEFAGFFEMIGYTKTEAEVLSIGRSVIKNK